MVLHPGDNHKEGMISEHLKYYIQTKIHFKMLQHKQECKSLIYDGQIFELSNQQGS